MKRFAENIWIQDQEQEVLGVELGARMTIVNLEDKGLFVHSPVKLTEPLKRELETLGKVNFLIAPNKWHHLYIKSFIHSYREAKVFCAPGLDKKRSDLRFDGVISDDQNFPWNPELQHIVIEGAPMVNEVVFFHAQSKTLILTDLALHICSSSSAYTRFWLKLIGAYGKFGWSRVEKLLFIRDHDTFDRSISKILSWDFERIILAHGSVIESSGKEYFRKAFG